MENLHFLWYLRKQIFFNLSKGKIIKLYNFENPYNVDSALYTAVKMKSYIWLQEKVPPFFHLHINDCWCDRHLFFFYCFCLKMFKMTNSSFFLINALTFTWYSSLVKLLITLARDSVQFYRNIRLNCILYIFLVGGWWGWVLVRLYSQKLLWVEVVKLARLANLRSPSQ